MPRYSIKEVDGTKVEVELLEGFSLSEQRQTTEGVSVTLEYGGLSLVLRERLKGTIEAAGDHTSAKGAVRTGEKTLVGALRWGVAELDRAIKRRSVSGETASPVSSGTYPTLIEARNLSYELNVWGHTSPDQQAKYKQILDMFLLAFGPGKSMGPWSQNDIDRLYAMRCGTNRVGRRLTAAELAAYGLKEAGLKFPAHYNRRSLPPVKPITLRNELADANVLFGYLMMQNVRQVDANGEPRRFLTNSPLAGLHRGTAIRGARADYHRDRYKWLLAAADHVDPTGQLRFVLVLVFLTGHRIAATLLLEMGHIGSNVREARALLRQVRRTHESEPTASEAWAPFWVHGAIYWVMENDKEDFDRVVPMSSVIRTEYDRYLGKRSRLLGDRESIWIFPRVGDPTKPLYEGTARDLLRAAEVLARPAIEAAGDDPEEIMQETPRDAFHPARGWFEARHGELGWTGNRNCSYVGGWTCNTGTVQGTTYGELDARLMLAAVEGRSYAEAAEELGLIEDAQAAINPVEPVIVPLDTAA